MAANKDLEPQRKISQKATDISLKGNGKDKFGRAIGEFGGLTPEKLFNLKMTSGPDICRRYSPAASQVAQVLQDLSANGRATDDQKTILVENAHTAIDALIAFRTAQAWAVRRNQNGFQEYEELAASADAIRFHMPDLLEELAASLAGAVVDRVLPGRVVFVFSMVTVVIQ